MAANNEEWTTFQSWLIIVIFIIIIIVDTFTFVRFIQTPCICQCTKLSANNYNNSGGGIGNL